MGDPFIYQYLVPIRTSADSFVSARSSYQVVHAMKVYLGVHPKVGT